MIINTSVSVNLWLAKGNIEWQKQLTQFTDTTNLLPDKECWMIIVAVTKHKNFIWTCGLLCFVLLFILLT